VIRILGDRRRSAVFDFEEEQRPTRLPQDPERRRTSFG
jgi:hypothetical protein